MIFFLKIHVYFRNFVQRVTDGREDALYTVNNVFARKPGEGDSHVVMNE